MSLRRTAAVLAAAAVAALVSAPAAQSRVPAGPTTDVGDAAAGWLARQLVDGDHFETVLDGVAYPDHGLTLDALFAFTAAGVASDSSDRAAAWLAEPEVLADYLSYGDPAQSFAGAHAKLALAAQVRGQDPTAFGGVDLIAGLTALQAPNGRFQDKSQYGDYSNGFTQAFAVLALDRWRGAPKAAVDYLAGTQCGDGGFPLILEATPCVSHVDATAMVVQALLAADRTDPAGKALDWLHGVQQASGGFLDEKATGEGNANSTGLAAQALRAGGRTADADEATAFLRSLQVDCSAPEAARGAIAFDRTGFTQATSLRASAQGVLGLVGVNFVDLTADGGRSGAPVLDCPVTSTSPTSSTSDTTTTTTTTTAATATSDTTATSTTTAAAVVAVTSRRDPLARTGAQVGPMLWVGALLLVGGVLAVVLARRRVAEARK
ncbi:prenyltransferase/squalene oxidase-like repeat protein [Saccharothrix saharensis]|uniref:Prenyltransferase/squalene oxidase-like repeat protein n=1 Tax=Saccharothrix saharensis TaxID=571190 RepID=A0A543J565_9PSEU|nr:prenyltransferase/squalene oxidase repeat-containing protein [Saccharothrix saharensis]TQM77984.1 prenyltransferase/squalene oxidase-like repeat protein [Saccharothrix saharensis]